jgi:hypothetical protein
MDRLSWWYAKLVVFLCLPCIFTNPMDDDLTQSRILPAPKIKTVNEQLVQPTTNSMQSIAQSSAKSPASLIQEIKIAFNVKARHNTYWKRIKDNIKELKKLLPLPQATSTKKAILDRMEQAMSPVIYSVITEDKKNKQLLLKSLDTIGNFYKSTPKEEGWVNVNADGREIFESDLNDGLMLKNLNKLLQSGLLQVIAQWPDNNWQQKVSALRLLYVYYDATDQKEPLQEITDTLQALQVATFPKGETVAGNKRRYSIPLLGNIVISRDMPANEWQFINSFLKKNLLTLANTIKTKKQYLAPDVRIQILKQYRMNLLLYADLGRIDIKTVDETLKTIHNTINTMQQSQKTGELTFEAEPSPLNVSSSSSQTIPLVQENNTQVISNSPVMVVTPVDRSFDRDSKNPLAESFVQPSVSPESLPVSSGDMEPRVEEVGPGASNQLLKAISLHQLWENLRASVHPITRKDRIGILQLFWAYYQILYERAVAKERDTIERIQYKIKQKLELFGATIPQMQYNGSKGGKVAYTINVLNDSVSRETLQAKPNFLSVLQEFFPQYAKHFDDNLLLKSPIEPKKEKKRIKAETTTLSIPGQGEKGDKVQQKTQQNRGTKDQLRLHPAVEQLTPSPTVVPHIPAGNTSITQSSQINPNKNDQHWLTTLWSGVRAWKVWSLFNWSKIDHTGKGTQTTAPEQNVQSHGTTMNRVWNFFISFFRRK